MHKYRIIALFFIVTLFSCNDGPGSKNDESILSVLYPTEDSVVKDSVLIELDFQDESTVLKVELWMNGDSTEIADYTSPFSLELNTKNYSNGPNTFFVRLYTLNEEIFDSEDINFTINNFLVFSTLFGSTEKNESGHSILQKQDSNFVVLGNVDSDVLTYNIINSPTSGMAEVSSSVLIYVPETNVTQTVTLTYSVADGGLLTSDEAMITINILSQSDYYEYISDLIDNIRSEFIVKSKLNYVKNNPLKIMHITNFNERFNGRLHYNTGRRINNGLIRNGHNVLSISDRDILHVNKSIKDPKGENTLHNKIIENFNNYKPDLVILGHADRVKQETLLQMKQLNKDLKIAQWFLDPLSKQGPDHESNKKRILDKIDIIDSSFLTTEPKSLNFNIKNSYFMPNPCDESFETLSNYKKNCNFDVFFAMSHGVHRGGLKSGKKDDREFFINKLIKLNPKLKFDIYGMNDVQPIWAEAFINRISNSYMGLNLSRGKPIKYYSSDRLVQLIGNGLLTFVDEKTQLGDFFDDNEMIFYKDIDDLNYKLNKYKKDTKRGKEIAKKGKMKYFKFFNSNIISDYLIAKTFNIKPKYKIIW